MIEKLKKQLKLKFEEEDFTSYFFVSAALSQDDRKFEIFLDGDDGISLGVCQKISRYLEEALDNDPDASDTYILEVSSPGTANSLVQLRQYHQHIGRTFDLLLKSGEQSERELDKIDNDTLFFKAPIDKRSKTQQKKNPIELTPIEVSIDQIEKAVVIISFK